VKHRALAWAAAASMALLGGCAGSVEPEIVPGIDGCRQCNMVIDQVRQACGYILGGEFVTFDSPGCLLQSYDALRRQGETPPTEVFFADYGDGTLNRAEIVTFLLTEHLPTVMDTGVLSFADRRAAEALVQHDDEVLTDWIGFRAARGEPDRVVAVTFDDSAMSPGVVEAEKGELLWLEASAPELEDPLVVAVKGYPEFEPTEIPAGGEEVVLRLLALKPGAGFPVVRAESGEALGMIKVSGSHTADEEAM